MALYFLMRQYLPSIGVENNKMLRRYATFGLIVLNSVFAGEIFAAIALTCVNPTGVFKKSTL